MTIQDLIALKTIVAQNANTMLAKLDAEIAALQQQEAGISPPPRLVTEQKQEAGLG